MTRSERIKSIQHWRKCEMLEAPFFSIRCGSTVMDTTSFGELVDFLLDSVEKIRYETALRCYYLAKNYRGDDGVSCGHRLEIAEQIHKEFLTE